MAWRLEKVEDQRKSLVEAYWMGTTSMSDLCKQFGVSRKTAYKWCNRYKRVGEKGLIDLSKSRLNPSKIYTEETIEMTLDLKLKKRAWGPKKILRRLSLNHPRMEW